MPTGTPLRRTLSNTTASENLLPPCLFAFWQHGTHCHCGILKDCLPHCWVAATVLQPNPFLAEMQVELLPLALSYHVPQRCTLILPPPSWTLQDCRAHQPDLLRGTNPSPKLTIWTRLTRFQFHILLLFQYLFDACCVVLCCSENRSSPGLRNASIYIYIYIWQDCVILNTAELQHHPLSLAPALASAYHSCKQTLSPFQHLQCALYSPMQIAACHRHL